MTREWEGHGKRKKNLGLLELDTKRWSILTQPVRALAMALTKCFTRAAGKIRSKSRLTFGGLETLKEHDSEIDVVQGRFTEGGDSILGAFFFCEPL